MPRPKRRRAPGLGTVYQRGQLWCVSWRENGRRRYSPGYPDRDTAEKVRAKIVADLAAGRGGLPEPEKHVPTLAELGAKWLERRQKTHRAVKQDRSRWNRHLKPALGSMLPDEVDAATIRGFVETKLVGLNSSTVGHCIRLLSTFYADLVERGFAKTNPTRSLPRATRRLYRPTTDPRNTPFIEKLADVRRVFLALPEPVNVAFAVGAFAGLRTGEVLGLEWRDVDLAARRLYVRQQVHEGELTGLKDDEARVVPIVEPLAPILAKWKLSSGGEGLLFRPKHPKRGGRPGRPAAFVRPRTLYRHLEKALAGGGLSGLTWYQSTRHTFASQWVLGGGSMEKLANVMGHSSVVVTERYAHLRPDLFRETDYRLFEVDLCSGAGAVAKLGGGTAGYSEATSPEGVSQERAAR